MSNEHIRHILGIGMTASGEFVAIRVGSDGELSGSGEPTQAHPSYATPTLLYGRTALGDYLPITVDPDGFV